jgi:hypothetical protein
LTRASDVHHVTRPKGVPPCRHRQTEPNLLRSTLRFVGLFVSADVLLEVPSHTCAVDVPDSLDTTTTTTTTTATLRFCSTNRNALVGCCVRRVPAWWFSVRSNSPQQAGRLCRLSWPYASGASSLRNGECPRLLPIPRVWSIVGCSAVTAANAHDDISPILPVL